jgi:hypothetical protein
VPPIYEPPTEKQLNYIDILVIDLNFTLKQCNFYMGRIAKRQIKSPDELSKWEASLVIDQFRKWKEAGLITDTFGEFNEEFRPDLDLP